MSLENSIKIGDPKAFPFGPLSNDYAHFMMIDGQLWPTVTSYVVSNMLNTPSYRAMVAIGPIRAQATGDTTDKTRQAIARLEQKKHKILDENEQKAVARAIERDAALLKMDIYQLYQHYNLREYTNILIRSVDEAYSALVNQYPNIANVLLSTNQTPIIYVSANDILGNGEDGTGQNIIGRTLMQIRERVRKDREESKRDQSEKDSRQNIIDVYRAYRILMTLIDMGETIEHLTGNSPTEIILKYNQAPYYKTIEQVPDDTIIDMYNRGNFPMFEVALTRPTDFVSEMITINYDEIVARIFYRHKRIIAEYFTRQVLRKRGYPENVLIKAAAQLQMAGDEISSREYLDLVNHIYTLYIDPVKVDKYFDNDTRELIEQDLAKFPFPQQQPDTTYGAIKPENKQELKRHDDDSPQSSSSSSEPSIDLENPLEVALSQNEKSKRRAELAERLSKFTGQAKSVYLRMTSYNLENEFALRRKQIEEKESKLAESKLAETRSQYVWLLRGRKLDDFGTGAIRLGYFRNKPDQATIQKVVNNYNKNNMANIDQSTCFLTKERGKVDVSFEDDESPIEKVTRNSQDDIDLLGPNIYIFAEKSRNNGKFYFFSPLRNQNFKVGQYVYPSVAIYLTTQLLTNTANLDDVWTTTKKIGTERARNLIMENGRFMSPAKARDIYHERDALSEILIYSNLLRIALRKKFENNRLKAFLMATKDRQIVYTLPTKRLFPWIHKRKKANVNIIGDILMYEVRDVLKVGDYPVRIEDDALSKMFDDPYLQDWMKRRFEKMCNVTALLADFIFAKTGQRIFNRKLAEQAVDIILNNCNFGNLTSKVPQSFRHWIDECPGTQFVPTTNYSEQIKELTDQIRSIYYESGEIDRYDLGLGEFLLRQSSQRMKQSSQAFADTISGADNELREMIKINPGKSALYQFAKRQLKDLRLKTKPDSNLRDLINEQKDKLEIYMQKNIDDETAREQFFEKMREIDRRYDPKTIPANEPGREDKIARMATAKARAVRELNREEKKEYNPAEFARRQREIEIEVNRARQEILRLQALHNEEFKQYNQELTEMLKIYWGSVLSMIQIIINYLKAQERRVTFEGQLVDFFVYNDNIYVLNSDGKHMFRNLNDPTEKNIDISKETYLDFRPRAEKTGWTIKSLGQYYSVLVRRPIISDARQILLNAQLLLSSKIFCEKTKEMCVADAILNVLARIEAVRVQYAPSSIMSENEIKFAIAVIKGQSRVKFTPEIRQDTTVVIEQEPQPEADQLFAEEELVAEDGSPEEVFAMTVIPDKPSNVFIPPLRQPQSRVAGYNIQNFVRQLGASRPPMGTAQLPMPGVRQVRVAPFIPVAPTPVAQLQFDERSSIAQRLRQIDLSRQANVDNLTELIWQNAKEIAKNLTNEITSQINYYTRSD